jgi:hypothetical protein
MTTALLLRLRLLLPFLLLQASKKDCCSSGESNRPRFRTSLAHDQVSCPFYRTIRYRVLFTARSGTVSFLPHDQVPCTSYRTIRSRVLLTARSGTVSFLTHDQEPCPSYGTIRYRILLNARSGTVSPETIRIPAPLERPLWLEHTAYTMVNYLYCRGGLGTFSSGRG